MFIFYSLLFCQQKSERTDATDDATAGKSSSFGIYSIIATVIIAIVSWFVYQGYLETRVNSTLAESKVALATSHAFPERYWGSFRPGVYFGIKTRGNILLYNNSYPHLKISLANKNKSLILDC